MCQGREMSRKQDQRRAENAEVLHVSPLVIKQIDPVRGWWLGADFAFLRLSTRLRSRRRFEG